MALTRRSWLARIRDGFCRRLLRGFSPEAPLSPRSIAALAIADAKWRWRIVRQASSWSALHSLADFIEKIEDTAFSHSRHFYFATGLILAVLFAPASLTTAKRWLDCEISSGKCGPRKESSIPLASGKPHRVDYELWTRAMEAPQVEKLGYCQREALWSLANAKRDASSTMPLSPTCATSISSALLSAKSSPAHDEMFLRSASNALSSARPTAISINEDLLSLSTWSGFKRQGFLSARDPSLPSAPLAFALSQWLFAIPGLALLGMLLIFFKNLWSWPKEFLLRNPTEVLVATEALIIELALEDGHALPPSSHASSPRKPRRL